MASVCQLKTATTFQERLRDSNNSSSNNDDDDDDL